jgi:hypothetical protein
MKHLLDASAHLFTGGEFTTVKLRQAFPQLLPEPYGVVNIPRD